MTIYKSKVPLQSNPPKDKSLYEFLLGDVSFDDSLEIFKECWGENRTLTLGQLKLVTHQLGLGLQQRFNLKPQDVVMISLPNLVAFPVAVFACQFAGCFVNLVNPMYTSREVQHVVDLVKPNAFITTSPLLDVLLRANVDTSRIILMDTDVGKGTTYYESLLTPQDEARKAKPHAVTDSNQTAYLPCSSGTTGLPKAVIISHFNIVSMIAGMTSVPNMYSRPLRTLAVAPFFHAMGLVVGLHLPLYVKGSSIAIAQRFEPTEFCDLIKAEKIDFVNAAPPMIRILALHPKAGQLSRLHAILVGAAPLDAELQRRAEKVFGCEITQGYGMTETTVGVCGGAFGQTAGSIGPPMPGVELRLVDDDGNDVETGKPGEVLAKASNICKGYFRNEEATRETFTPCGQWLKTGDVAICDPKTGDFTIVDRKKELIKYKGYQVAPAELEGILIQHDKIAAAGVIGVYSQEQATELPRAYIQLKPQYVEQGNDEALLQEVDDFCASQTSSQKRLRGGIRVVKQVPLNPSGKILRKELRLIADIEQKEAKSRL